MFKNLHTCFAVTAVSFCFVLFGNLRSGAEEEKASGLQNIKITGYGSYESGQIVSGEFEGSGIDHYWQHQVFAGLGFMSKLNERFELVAGVEGKMWNPYQSGNLFRDWTEQHMSLWLTEASGTYSIGDLEKPLIKLTAGYFPYKYNPEVRNLGEFMFRSLTYPGLIFNSFDFPATRQLGFKASLYLQNDIFSIVNDLMILEQAANWPFGDFSIAYLGSFNLLKIVEIGAGVDLANIISVNSNNTTPKVTNGSVTNMIVLSSDQTGKKVYDSASFYTFTAIKPMVRLTIDPKPALKGVLEDVIGMLSPDDLKLYGEAAIIGLKKYPYYYDTLSQRMPMMAGFYVPTFKILDMLNLEAEYYPTRLLTSYYNQVYPISYNNGVTASNVCVPVPVGFSAESKKATAWKWSIYLKKTIMPNVAFTLQFSKDHYRLNYVDGYPTYSESLVKNGQWMWIAKFSGSL